MAGEAANPARTKEVAQMNLLALMPIMLTVAAMLIIIPLGLYYTNKESLEREERAAMEANVYSGLYAGQVVTGGTYVTSVPVSFAWGAGEAIADAPDVISGHMTGVAKAASQSQKQRYEQPRVPDLAAA